MELLNLILEEMSGQKRVNLLKMVARQLKKEEICPVLTKQVLLNLLISDKILKAPGQKETTQLKKNIPQKEEATNRQRKHELSHFLMREKTRRKKEKDKDKEKKEKDVEHPKRGQERNPPFQDPVIELNTGETASSSKQHSSVNPSSTSSKKKAKTLPPRINDLKNINKLRSTDLEKGFFKFFQSRYEKFKKILKKKKLSNLVNVREAKRRRENNKRSVIIMVSDKRTVKNGKGGLIRGEDESGMVKLFVPFDPPLEEKFHSLLKNSVIACQFHKSSSGLPIVDDILFPDIPYPREKSRANHSHKVLFLSDLHVGSKDFLKGVFDTFINFIQGNVDGENEAEEIDYIIITGDVIDGVGVYPNQQREVVIDKVEKQYEIVREYLKKIPEDKRIIIIPGNHDAAGRLLPQPPSPFFEGINDLPNINLLSNPALVEIEGVDILLFHGQGFEEIAGSLGFGVNSPTKIATQVLKQRHLCPIWDSVSNFPIREDPLVIDRTPDIMATGHLHVYGYKKYKSTLILNSGSFQGKTSWQRELGIQPTPGLFPVVNLKNFKVKFLDFTE